MPDVEMSAQEEGGETELGGGGINPGGPRLCGC